MVDHDMVRLF